MLKNWIVLILFFFISCKPGSDVPGGVLPVNEMKLVMWDMIQADEMVNYNAIRDTTINRQQESLKLYGKVFHLHKITEADYGKSYEYYRLHPEMEKELLDSLQSYGNKMREVNYQKMSLELPPPPLADTALKN